MNYPEITSKKHYWLSAIVLLIALIASVGVIYGQPLVSYISSLNGNDGQPVVQDTPEEKGNAPVRSAMRKFLLPEGRQEYRVMQAAETWPKILEATIDPPDVHVGDIQKLEIVVQGIDEIVSVEAVTQLDHDKVIIPLKLIGEVAAGDLLPNPFMIDISGRLVRRDRTGRDVRNTAGQTPAAVAAETPRLKYAAEWRVYDTHDTFYRTTFIVKDFKGRTNDITIAWSDACGIPNDGSFTMVNDCTISADDGIEAGNLTLGTNVDITLNADFAFNPGNSIIMGSNTTIVVAAGSSILQGYAWANDADGDGYYDAMIVATADPGINYHRRNTRTAYGDCDDNDPTVWTDGTAYEDTDGDGYGAGPLWQVCYGNSLPAGYSADNTDCDPNFNTQWRDVTNLVVDDNMNGYYSSGSTPTTLCVGASSVVGGRTYYTRGGSYSCQNGYHRVKLSETLGTESSVVDCGNQA